MGLFGKKKKKPSDLPEVPEFPRIPEQQPAYEPEFQKQFPPSQPLPARNIPATPRDFNPNVRGIEPIKPSPEFLKETGLPPVKRDENLPNPAPESQQGLLPHAEPHPATPRPLPHPPQQPRPLPQPPQQRPLPQPHNYDNRMAQPMPHQQMPHHGAEKPLFIKIDEYKESLRHLEMLRNKIEEVEDYIARLESIKVAEDDELKKCKANVNEMKRSLMDIDKRLFEV